MEEEKQEKQISSRRSSIYFFFVLFLMFTLVFVALYNPLILDDWSFLTYFHLILLIPVAIIKEVFSSTKLAKWLATSVILYKFK